jgi:hypothetical protein
MRTHDIIDNRNQSLAAGGDDAVFCVVATRSDPAKLGARIRES